MYTTQANSFPVRNDTMRVQKMKAEIEREMANLEEKIRQHERPKVFVKIEDWEKSIQKISVWKNFRPKKLKKE